MMSKQTKSELQKIADVKERLVRIILDPTVSFRFETSDFNPSELKYKFTGANRLMDKNFNHPGLMMEIEIQKLYDRALGVYYGTLVILTTVAQDRDYPTEYHRRTREFVLPDFDLFVPIYKRYSEMVPDVATKYKSVSEQYEKIKAYLVDFEITKNIKTK